MKLDILAIAAHPDDIELSCSGTLALHQQKGYKIGIVDLTAGELGSRGTPQTRKTEAEEASRILKIDVRENLGFRDGFFQNDETHQKTLIQIIRKYQPDIVLANAPTDRHPDHGRAALLVRDACFYSGLVKIETEFEGKLQAAWRPKKVFNYIQDQDIEPDFIIDISETFHIKMDSIKAFTTQFYSDSKDGPMTYISSQGFLDTLEFRNRVLGKRIGVKYGEGFITPQHEVGLRDFSAIIMPSKV
ncbi:MAG: bacillithiol biosynthesis deacetylase BshB1 [Bacteroidetes bacterium]|nr:bacillithiol biosynthesis deacetylase BshB1 [Bacteroidota bacterium]